MTTETFAFCLKDIYHYNESYNKPFGYKTLILKSSLYVKMSCICFMTRHSSFVIQLMSSIWHNRTWIQHFSFLVNMWFKSRLESSSPSYYTTGACYEILDLLKIIFISEFVQADRVYAGEQIWPVQPYTWYEHCILF